MTVRQTVLVVAPEGDVRGEIGGPAGQPT